MIGYIVCFILGGLAVYLIGQAIDAVRGIEEQYAHPSEEDLG